MRGEIVLSITKKLSELKIKKEVNSACHGWLYQPVLPKRAKEKFGK